MTIGVDSKVIVVAVKIGEGKSVEKVDKIAQIVDLHSDLILLDLRRRPEYNYSILKFGGEISTVLETLDIINEKIFNLLDFSNTRSLANATGSLSSIVLIPIRNIAIDDCKVYIRTYAQNFSEKFRQPVILFAEAAHQDRKRINRYLHSLTAKQFAKEFETGKIVPDFGKNYFNPRRGITLMGVRKYIVSAMFYLDTGNLDIAQGIADEIGKQGRILYDREGKPLRHQNGNIRRGKGKFPTVSTVAGNFVMENMTQILCNLEDYDHPNLFELYKTVKEVANKDVVEILGTSIIEYLPWSAIETTILQHEKYHQSLQYLSIQEKLTIFIKLLNLESIGDFNPYRQIIDFQLIPSLFI